MEFSEVVRRRRMVRHHTDQPLEPEVIERVLASALRAPSAGFSQGWAFLALTRRVIGPVLAVRADQGGANTDQEGRAAGGGAAGAQGGLLERYAEPDKGWEDRAESRWPAPYWYIDTGMAAMMMLLTAVDEGLGACLFGIMPEQIGPFRAEFGIPDEYAPIGRHHGRVPRTGFASAECPNPGTTARRQRRRAPRPLGSS